MNKIIGFQPLHPIKVSSNAYDIAYVFGLVISLPFTILL